MSSNAEERKARRLAATQRWRANNPDKVKAANARRVNDPEKNSAAHAAWVVANPGKAAARNRALVERLKQQKRDDPTAYLLKTSKARAGSKGFAFDLDYEYLQPLVAPLVCQVSKLPLQTVNTSFGRTNPWGPSLDRIDGAKGYIKGNVRVVCWAFNQMRSDFSDEVIMKLVKALYPLYTDEASK